MNISEANAMCVLLDLLEVRDCRAALDDVDCVRSVRLLAQRAGKALQLTVDVDELRLTQAIERRRWLQ